MAFLGRVLVLVPGVFYALLNPAFGIINVVLGILAIVMAFRIKKDK